METKTHTSKFLKWSLIIGIVILLNLFFNYALYLIFPTPEYVKFCPNDQVIVPPTTQKACVSAGGQWIETTTVQDVKVAPVAVRTTQPSGYCNINYTCSNNFEQALKTYNKNIFISLVVLGVVTLALGLFLRTTDAVSVSLALGGVLCLFIGSVRYWSYADTILKLVILGIALVALIWIGAKKFQE